jgi:hypothetical protein
MNAHLIKVLALSQKIPLRDFLKVQPCYEFSEEFYKEYLYLCFPTINPNWRPLRYAQEFMLRIRGERVFTNKRYTIWLDRKTGANKIIHYTPVSCFESQLPNCPPNISIYAHWSCDCNGILTVRDPSSNVVYMWQIPVMRDRKSIAPSLCRNDHWGFRNIGLKRCVHHPKHIRSFHVDMYNTNFLINGTIVTATIDNIPLYVDVSSSVLEWNRIPIDIPYTSVEVHKTGFIVRTTHQDAKTHMTDEHIYELDTSGNLYPVLMSTGTESEYMIDQFENSSDIHTLFEIRNIPIEIPDIDDEIDEEDIDSEYQHVPMTGVFSRSAALPIDKYAEREVYKRIHKKSLCESVYDASTANLTLQDVLSKDAEPTLGHEHDELAEFGLHIEGEELDFTNNSRQILREYLDAERSRQIGIQIILSQMTKDAVDRVRDTIWFGDLTREVYNAN